MAKHTTTPAPSDLTLIAQDAVFEGTVRAVGDLRIDGRVVGTVRAKQRVVIAAKGYVEGQITTDTADVAGHVAGNVYAAERLVLRSQAFVQGDIQAPKLAVEDGAVFSGTCRMQHAESALVAALPAPAAEPAESKAALHRPDHADEVADEVEAAVPVEPVEVEEEPEAIDEATLDDMMAQVDAADEEGAEHPSALLDEATGLEETEEPGEIEAGAALEVDDAAAVDEADLEAAGALKEAEGSDELEVAGEEDAAAPEVSSATPQLATVATPPKPVSVAYWDRRSFADEVAVTDEVALHEEALEDEYLVSEARDEAAEPQTTAPDTGAPASGASLKPTFEPSEPPASVPSVPADEGEAPQQSMPQRLPGPPEKKTEVRVPAPIWSRGTGLIAVMVVLLLLGGYFGIQWIRGDEAPPPERIAQQTAEASVAPVAGAAAAEGAASLDEVTEPEPEVDEEARRGAEQEQQQMEEARQRVAERSTEAEVVAAFRQADAARRTGLQQFEAAAFEQAERSFREARDQYVLVQQRLVEKDQAQEEAALAEAATEQEEPTTEETEVDEEATLDPSAETTTPAEADNSAAIAHVQTVSRRLSTYLKSNIEQENLGGMQALFYRGWDSFFEEADQISATVRTGDIEVDGARARVVAQVNLTYQDREGEPQQQTQSHVWELTQMSGDWVLTRVVAQR